MLNNKIMDTLSLQVCPVCSVKIESGEKVLFSHGKPGTRERLYARVCQYAKKSGCINTSVDAGTITDDDRYLVPTGISC